MRANQETTPESKVIFMTDKQQWTGFEGRKWKMEIDVRDFIQNNYTPYDGDESF